MGKLNYNLCLPLQGNDENPSVLTCLGKHFFCTGGGSMESLVIVTFSLVVVAGIMGLVMAINDMVKGGK